MIIQVIAAFAAIFTFAMALEIPKKYLINCGFIGAAGWFVYLVVLQRFGMMTANLLGAAAITLRIFLQESKSTGDDFFDPGFLTLVPGQDYIAACITFYRKSKHGAAYLVQTLQIAGVIALGVFMVDSLVEIIGKRKQKEEKNNQSQVKIGCSMDCTCIIEKR